MEEWKFHPLPKTQGTAFHSVYWEVFFPCKRQDCDKQYFTSDKVFLCKPPAWDGSESGAGTWSPDPHIRHNSGDTPAPIPGVLHPHHGPQAAPPEWQPWGGAQDIQEEEGQERFPTCLHEGDAVLYNCWLFQYYTFQAIRHEKLSQPHSPCDPTPDYSFGCCVERYLVQLVGYQPPWSRFGVEGVPLCDTWTLLSRYSEENRRLTEEMDRAEIIEATQCLLPCSYMEYRVSTLLLTTDITSK